MLFHEREFKAHLDKALKAALTEYQAEEVKRAENAREATKKARGHNTIGEWDEQYELSIRHTKRWGSRFVAAPASTASKSSAKACGACGSTYPTTSPSLSASLRLT